MSDTFTIKIDEYYVDIQVDFIDEDEIDWHVVAEDESGHNDYLNELLHEYKEDEIVALIYAEYKEMMKEAKMEQQLSNLEG